MARRIPFGGLLAMMLIGSWLSADLPVHHALLDGANETGNG